MADWKQIQARIRKAKNSSDPVARLTELYAKTRDGMAAFEVGAAAEKAGRMEEAVHWYTTAHGRFRRAEWRSKAAEALSRLGAPIPAPSGASLDASAGMHDAKSFSIRLEPGHAIALDSTISLPPPQESLDGSLGPARGPSLQEQPAAVLPRQMPPMKPEPQEPGSSAALSESGKRRRRGRRGGHGRGRQTALSPAKFAPARNVESQAEPKQPWISKPAVTEASAPYGSEAEDAASDAPIFTASAPAERPAAPYRAPRRSRLADPGISSRLAQLEALLRRLIAAQEHPLSEAEEAPAGPGVFVLSDSDLVTFYYVEACRTLRVAIANLAKGRNIRATRTRSAPSENSPIRARLSEHLDISEAKVSQYIKQHCVVRWLQLDEEAHHLAHLAIAVLRPPLNFE
jgi:hypothetical protein